MDKKQAIRLEIKWANSDSQPWLEVYDGTSTVKGKLFRMLQFLLKVLLSSWEFYSFYLPGISEDYSLLDLYNFPTESNVSCMFTSQCKFEQNIVTKPVYSEWFKFSESCEYLFYFFLTNHTPLFSSQIYASFSWLLAEW